mmetsp:Transcript_21910/g.37401  ORF Transcript_21910/g.37401 Transcript_21910/m.37401 type:complete len:202 (-) Transcript_21910:821-1426(-)
MTTPSAPVVRLAALVVAARCSARRGEPPPTGRACAPAAGTSVRRPSVSQRSTKAACVSSVGSNGGTYTRGASRCARRRLTTSASHSELVCGSTTAEHPGATSRRRWKLRSLSALARGSTGACRGSPAAGRGVAPTASRRASKESRGSCGPMGSTTEGQPACASSLESARRAVSLACCGRTRTRCAPPRMSASLCSVSSRLA